MTPALLHGFLGDPEVWDDGANGIAGATFALPGHAGGDPVLSTWAANLDAIAARIRGYRLVIGYSLGARVALGLVAIGAVPRAILVSVNPGIPDTAATERAARRASDATWAQRFRTEPLADVLDAWEAQPLFATQARAPAARLASRRARRLTLDPEQMARSLEAMGLAEMPDYRAELSAGRCTIVVGEDDAKYVAIARASSAPVHVIPRAGHDPLLEQPAALAKVLASLS